MRLQKLILGILIVLTGLTIFARGQELVWDTLMSSNASLPSTETGIIASFEDIQYDSKVLSSGDSLIIAATGEILGTGRDTQQVSGAVLTWQNTSGTTQVDTQTWLVSSWIEPAFPHLLISEVFYDWTDEWLELTNLGATSFSGKIQLSWSINISTFVSIDPQQSILLLKPSGNYARIDLAVLRITTNTFSLTDTKAINLTLLTSGQFLDEFLVETGRVTKLDNKKTSFQKFQLSGARIITWTTIPINVSDGYIANPWIILQESPQNPPETSTGSSLDNTWQALSGQLFTGENSPLKITEISDYTWQFSPFIELEALDDWSGSLTFSGSLLKEGFFLDEKLIKWEIFIVSSSDNWWLAGQKIIVNPRLYLQKSWFLSIYGQSRQVFDTVQILSIYPWKSLYYSDISQSGVRLFDKVDMFSPGFDEKLLWYFSGWKTECTSISPISWTTVSVTPKMEMSSGVQFPDPGMVQIKSLVFKGDESITLVSLRTGDIVLSDHKRYLLTRAAGKTERWSTKKYLTGTLASGQSITITKTFWFLDGGGCVSLWYSGSLYDSFCYAAPIPEPKIPKVPKISTGDLLLTGLSELTGQLTWSIIPQVSIISLLPNPAGKDSSEMLILWSSWDYLFTGFFLKVNTTKHKLNSFIYSGITEITGSLWLINKAACVQLWRTSYQLDSFCYTTPKDNQRFGQTNPILNEIGQTDFSLLSKASFVLTGNQICIAYEKQALRCRSLPASKTSTKLKNQNKLYKTYANLLEDYLRKNRSTLFYQTPLKEYFSVFSDAKKAINESQSTISISGQQIDVQDISTQIRLKTTTGSVESGYENGLPKGILWVQKLLRRGVVLWNHRSNFFSISNNPALICGSARCFTNAALDWPKRWLIADQRSNFQNKFCRKQEQKTNSPPPKYVGIWTI